MTPQQEREAYDNHTWSTGCEICDDALNSGHIRCSCRWSASGKPPTSHNGSCAMTPFEGRHIDGGRSRDESNARVGYIAKRVDEGEAA